jgi:superoxide dismutase, Fe-Mn family
MISKKQLMKTTRRDFLEKSLKTAAISALGLPLLSKNVFGATGHHAVNGFEFSQIKLPYSYNALEPHIDAQTMEIHYTKHHATYVKNVNEAIGTEKIIVDNEDALLGNVSKYPAKIRNNAGGVWNHNFFWMVMKPATENNLPSGKLAEALNASFGSFEKFKEQFTQAAMTRFGSGWAWLVSNSGKLAIGSTPNQDNPLMDVSDFKGKPMLALDVWEHAYYLKYQNKRNEYVSNWWNLVNWDEVSKRLV